MGLRRLFPPSVGTFVVRGSEPRSSTHPELIAFLLAMALALYFYATPKFLADLGIPDHRIQPVQTIGQISEIPALLLLPLALRRLGIKGTFAVGLAAWTLRFLIFSLGWPVWLVVASIGLHGLCHVFILIVAQLYVDSQCPPNVRASAQNLLAVLAFGIGLPAGFVLSGLLTAAFTEDAATDYQQLFLLPTLILGSLLIVFLLGFRAPGSAAER
ncbi:MAG: MFS transporter [Planctomycetes bacterium]|nr:MFS transporter [Planctomycetota bacterium]